MQRYLFQRYCLGSIIHIKTMKYSGHRKLLCELYQNFENSIFLTSSITKTNTDASFLVYKFGPERTGFNMYAENTQQQLTFLAAYYFGQRFDNIFFFFITQSKLQPSCQGAGRRDLIFTKNKLTAYFEANITQILWQI